MARYMCDQNTKVNCISKCKIKTTMRYHLTPVRMAIINKSTSNKCGEDVEKGEPFALFV